MHFYINSTFQRLLTFPSSIVAFQLHRNFPTSNDTFQLRSVLFNFAWFFPNSAKFFNIRPSNFSFFPTTLFNCTYPLFKNIDANIDANSVHNFYIISTFKTLQIKIFIFDHSMVTSIGNITYI